METRPLASILFVNVETKRSFSQLTKTRSPHSLLAMTLHLGRPGGRLPAGVSPDHSERGRGGRSDLGPLPNRRPATVSCPVRTGPYGIAWDHVVVNGLLGIITTRRGFAPRRTMDFVWPRHAGSKNFHVFPVAWIDERLSRLADLTHALIGASSSDQAETGRARRCRRSRVGRRHRSSRCPT
jgi:hypothetical protein